MAAIAKNAALGVIAALHKPQLSSSASTSSRRGRIGQVVLCNKRSTGIGQNQLLDRVRSVAIDLGKIFSVIEKMRPRVSFGKRK